MEPKKDTNLKHLSVLTLLVFLVGFIVMWMLASIIWGMTSNTEREMASATRSMENSVNGVSLDNEASSLDNLDVDQSTNDVMGATTGDPELDTQVRDLNNINLEGIDNTYR